jgi:ubiquinone/menaquinone biosynthesis C-methylase UbiE
MAETYGCRVTGIDLTQAFCDAATAMSDWVGLGSRVSFKQGDATNLPFENQIFDAAMTIHVAMNIAAKDKVYLEARRVLKPSGVFAVYECCKAKVAKSYIRCHGRAIHQSAMSQRPKK